MSATKSGSRKRAYEFELTKIDKSNRSTNDNFNLDLDFDLEENSVRVARKIRGSIICTASVVASFPGGAGHKYTVSKHDVLGLVQLACGELVAYRIRVDSISPYAPATPMTCAALDVGPAEVEAVAYGFVNLEGITLKANQIAEAALFLASDESLYISGHKLVVDGGYSAVNR
ncbi:short-chain dehydrogenase reductase 3b-like [Vigna radiata var. radiata]|uniref:Short-chain dehydrogenase reductase 3b-like n=1 Tax=Vigna radiata var. radiata TaxID=3916 RepID=A0A1S3TBE8_VIGRR|nr:short-chain dehydrogenase reductase 3b-like [Vigna radiata var. radiata]